MNPQRLKPYKTFQEIAEIAEGHLTQECEDMECTAILSAYDCLPQDTKRMVEKQAKKLVGMVARRNPLRDFNFLDAVYVLGKIGVWMVQNGAHS